MYRYASLLLILGILVLAGCNFNADDEESTATPGTPVAWATAWTPTATPLASETPAEAVNATEISAVLTSAAPTSAVPTATPLVAPSTTSTPFALPSATPQAAATGLPQATALPQATQPAMQVFTPTPPPSFTPLAAAPVVTATLTPYVQPGVTAAPALPTATSPSYYYNPPASFTPGMLPTLPPMQVFTPTPAPTLTSVLAPTYTPIYAQPPTFTPAPLITVPASSPAARVCATCGNLRLRDTPGSAGAIVTTLEALTPVTVIGRTQDNAWAQIVLVSGLSGWVASQYLELTIDLSTVAVTGNAVTLPTQVPPVIVTNIDTDIISGVSSHARQIYLNGRAMGVRGNVFSKVGDSITVAPYFLHQFVDVYNLADYSYLAPALRFFYGPDASGGNPFSRNSLAAGNGWSTVSVLDPNTANHSVCLAGETPLACEYRVAKPAVALIMLGTNDSGGLSIETYRANMQRIIDISVSMGVIPVLSTIPPMRYEPSRDARIAEFNAVIVALARGNDIPLWNYWKAMNALPSQGLGPDGVHPNGAPDAFNAHLTADHMRYGYPVRNLGALQMLYELWRQVLYDGGTYVSDPVATAVPPSDNPTGPTPTSAPPGSYSCAGALPVQLTVGGVGRVTPGLPNKMRATPSMSGAAVGSIPGEGRFTVVAGPVCADGYTWWQVLYEGVTGWTAQGDGSEYWVEPAS